jgi:hypothetical protein
MFFDEFIDTYQKALQFGNDNQKWTAHDVAASFFSNISLNLHLALDTLNIMIDMLDNGHSVEHNFGMDFVRESVEIRIEAVKQAMEERGENE